MKLVIRRNRMKAQSIAEFGPALWIMFVGILFPMFIMASLTIRFAIFHTAAYMSCRNAVSAKNFLTDSTTTYGSTTVVNYSAVHQAQKTAQSFVSSFPGVFLVPTNAAPTITAGGPPPSSTGLSLYIVNIVYNSASGTYTTTTGSANTPLATVPNSGINQIKLVMVGQVSPLLMMSGGFMGLQIDGLTKPMVAIATEQMIFENNQGLTQ